MDYESILEYSNDTVDVDLGSYIDDMSLLDEIPDSSRFISLEDFLKRGDDNYEKWGMEWITT